MDDLVVIILTLIVLGIGALGQLKKKKQAEANFVQPEQSEDFWDLVEEGTEIPDRGDVLNFIQGEKPQTIMKADVSSYKIKEKSKDQTQKSDDFSKKSMAVKAKKKKDRGVFVAKSSDLQRNIKQKIYINELKLFILNIFKPDLF